MSFTKIPSSITKILEAFSASSKSWVIWIIVLPWAFSLSKKSRISFRETGSIIETDSSNINKSGFRDKIPAKANF